MSENSKLYINLFIAAIIGFVTFIFFPLTIHEPPTYIEFTKVMTEKQQLTSISNEITSDNKIKKGTKNYKKELQKRIDAKRQEYFNKIKDILVPDVSQKDVWDECDGDTCTQLSLKQILGLEEFSRKNRDFVTDVCMLGVNEPDKYKFIEPEYKADIENNRCVLVGAKENNEILMAFYLIKILICFMISYSYMVLITILHYREKNKSRKPNEPIII